MKIPIGMWGLLLMPRYRFSLPTGWKLGDYNQRLIQATEDSSNKKLEELEMFKSLDPKFEYKRPKQPQLRLNPFTAEHWENYKYYWESCIGVLIHTDGHKLKRFTRHLDHLSARMYQYGKKDKLSEEKFDVKDSWDEDMVILGFEILQNENLGLEARIWMLGCMRMLRGPIHDLEKVRKNIKDGPLCRGAWELYLSEEFDSNLEARKIWGNGIHDPGRNLEIISLGILEVLERVNVFVKIRKYLQSTLEYSPTSPFIHIHDTFIQEGSHVDKLTASSIALICAEHIRKEGLHNMELMATYRILHHLEKFNHERLKLFQISSNEHKTFMIAYQKAEIQAEVEKITSGMAGRLNLWIRDYLEPFSNLEQVKIFQFQQVLDVMKSNTYLGDQDALFKILERASRYTNDAQLCLQREICLNG
ncbi:hypothetical protein CROQUDRAFT_716270 [Cronartium quercuum f. sp. fusiforme G11]|uniref:Uncharacterized protein n=1 Tax=Cronartium quercuum f. sp. fusiforme G11 TaxID=708437 RepID=A0A9P6NE67_9BASI|nr:hypothetical protein CROQUDRAFT_716270 [Cronartium quercuum f. sp. fusiforme G11]